MQAHAYERVLRTEMELSVKEGERRARLEQRLRDPRPSRLPLRARALLTAFAYKLSLSAEDEHPLASLESASTGGVMNVQEHFLMTEMQLKVEAGERRGQLEQALTDYKRSRPSLRERTATLLVALADRLSPEAVTAFEEHKPLHHA